MQKSYKSPVFVLSSQVMVYGYDVSLWDSLFFKKKKTFLFLSFLILFLFCLFFLEIL